MTSIRVLIADDHAIVRDGVRLILTGIPDITVVGLAENGSEALRLAQELKPDVILMDIAMPGLGGLEATARLRQILPDIRVVVLSMHENQEYILQILEAGAAGYLPKRAAGTELVAAIRIVHSGQTYLHPMAASALLQGYVRQSEALHARGNADGLSPREQEVLTLIAQGSTSQEIADRLCLSVKTVQTHRAHILEKLDLHNQTDLVRYAIRKGFIDT